jgi:hypothetical protein
VPIEAIKLHGTWSSNSVWSYLNPPTHAPTLPHILARAVQTHTV